MAAHLYKRLRGFVLVALIVAFTIAPGCGTTGTDPIAIALSGTYNVLSGGNTLGTATIANGLLTNWLTFPVTNPQTPTVNGGLITWKGTVDAGSFLPGSTGTAELTVEVTNQGNGTLTGRSFLTIVVVQFLEQQITMQLQ